MALTPTNWSINSYTVATWTDLVAVPATVAAIVISNTAAGNAVVQLRLEDGGSGLATILPPTTLLPDDSFTLDVRSLNITGTQALQMQADIAGVEILASGVV